MKKLFSIFFALLGLTVAVSCNDPKPDEPPVNDGLILASSDRYFLADGKAEVKFTVTLNGVDVTAKAKIVNFKESGSETLATPSFKTTVTGTHVFYTIVDGEISSRIAIQGATAFPELASDVMPTKYDFVKRAFVMQSTGAWCQACPYTIRAIHEFLDKDPKAADAVFVAAHNGDILTNDKSNRMNGEFNVAGSYPSVFFDMSKDPSRKVISLQKPEQIRGQVNSILETDAVSGISVATKIVNGKICVRAEVKIGDAGTYRVGALLLEDNLFAKQTNGTPVTGDYLDYHDFVVRAGYPTVDLHELVGGLDKVNAQSKHQFYCEFDVKKSLIESVAKTNIVIFVYNTDKKACDNVVVTPLEVQLPYEYR